MGVVIRPKGYVSAHADSADGSSVMYPELIERAGLTRPWAAIALGVGLYLFQLLAVYLDGFESAFSSPEFWRRSPEMPVIITYVLLIHGHTDERARRAVAAFRPLVAVNDTTYRELVKRMSTAFVRYQPVGMFLFLLLGVVLQGVWEWENGFYWTALAEKVTIVVEYSLIGSILYMAVAGNRLFSGLFKQPLKIDVFNLAPVKPIAEWGLGFSLAIIGGITISVLSIWDVEDLLSPEQLIVYVVALGSAVLVYFASLFSTHRMMARTKEEELSAIRGKLAGLYSRLKESQWSRTEEDGITLASEVTAWLSYERRIMDAPEWPHTAGTLQGLFASILLPIVLTITQLVLRR